MKNEFEEHGNALTTAVGGLIATGAAFLVGILGKKIKEKANEKEEEVILETKNIKISKKQ